MRIFEFTNASLPAEGAGNGLSGLRFTVRDGEFIGILSDSDDDARTFLKSLTLVVPPVRGDLRFRGTKVDYSDYRNLLPIKREIGYIGADAALFGNRTLRDNLLFSRYYFENSLLIDLCDQSRELCDAFGLTEKLDRRPGEVSLAARRIAVMVRELVKPARLLILDRPGDYLGHSHFDRLIESCDRYAAENRATVCYSHSEAFIRSRSDRVFGISDGKMELVARQETR